MIPSNNPFRKLGKFESFVAAFMAEDDKKPLMTWFDKFEKALKKLGTNYKKSSINPTDALEYYYDNTPPEEAAKNLAESVEVDEYIKKTGARKRCDGGDGRRTDVEVTELSRDEPEVVFDFKKEKDAKQFAKDVENSAVGLANSGVERYKGKYRVVITTDKNQKDWAKKAIGKYAKKNKGEFSHSSSEVTPKGYGPYDESVEEVDEIVKGISFAQHKKLKKAGGRQLKDPRTEVMVVDKKGKVIVIDKKDLEKYEKQGWNLAESLQISKDEQKLLDFINKNW